VAWWTRLESVIFLGPKVLQKKKKKFQNNKQCELATN